MNKMKTNIKNLILVLLAMLLTMSGCQTGHGETVSSENIDEETENVERNYEYKDIVLDRSLTEGKFACYYFRSDYEYTAVSGTAKPGEASLLIAPDGTTMLIDINSLVNAAHVVEALQKLGIDKLDYFVMSHEHYDSVEGYQILFRYIEVEQVVTNGFIVSSETTHYNYRLMQDLEEWGKEIVVWDEGTEVDFGGAKIKVFGPFDGYDHENTDDVVEDNGSLVFTVRYGDSSYFFGGDILSDMEKQLIEKYGEELKCDVTKMNHHGDEDAECSDWVKNMGAKIAVSEMSSVLSETVFFRYMMYDAIPLNTYHDGTVVVYTTGDGTYDIQVEMERLTDAYGTLDTEDGHMRVE